LSKTTNLDTAMLTHKPYYKQPKLKNLKETPKLLPKLKTNLNTKLNKLKIQPTQNYQIAYIKLQT